MRALFVVTAMTCGTIRFVGGSFPCIGFRVSDMAIVAIKIGPVAVWIQGRAMVENIGLPLICAVTDIALLGADEMPRQLSGRLRTIVTSATGPGDIGMIEID